MFNGLINFNDGLLTELISENEQMDHEQSTEAVTGFVEELEKQLEEHGSVLIEGIGTLIRDEGGKTGLSAEKGTGAGEAAGPDTGMTGPEDNTTDPAEHFSLDESGTIEKNAPQEELGEEGSIPAGNTQEEDAFIIEPAKEKEDASGRPPAPAASRKQLSPVAMSGIILAAALVLAVGTILLIRSGFFSGRPGADLPPGTVTAAEQSGANTSEAGKAADEQDAVQAGGITVEQEVAPSAGPAAGQETVQGDQQAGGAAAEAPFYVVAGVFIHRDNAERYVETLKSRGYDASIFGRRKNMYGVSFRAFGTRQEALSYMERIRAEFEPRAWVLHYRN